MSKKSQAVEILPTFPIDIMTGSIKHCTFRVDKEGRNMVMPKVLQPNKTGRQPEIPQGASIKWRSLSDNQKQYWQEIAKDYDFHSRWTAFVSSFFLAVDLHGLDYVMAHELSYIYSKNRHKRDEHWLNSKKRRAKYKPNPKHYDMTKETLATYPVDLLTPFIYLKLLDLNDVNNALRCKMLIRTDPLVEYEFFLEQEGEIEKGSYIRRQRPRIANELYELVDLNKKSE